MCCHGNETQSGDCPWDAVISYMPDRLYHNFVRGDFKASKAIMNFMYVWTTYMNFALDWLDLQEQQQQVHRRDFWSGPVAIDVWVIF